MTAEQRLVALLRSEGWHDSGNLCKQAEDWHAEQLRAITRVKASQWEALLRTGSDARTLDEFLTALDKHLVSEPESERPKYRLNDKALTESLVGEVKRAALQETKRKTAFDSLAFTSNTEKAYQFL